MKLKGKRIIVTGGARGMAASIVRAYAQEGAQIASIDILDIEGQQVADEATKMGPGKVDYYHCDISRKENVENTFEMATRKIGGLDILVNAAGVNQIRRPEELTEQDIDLIFHVNVYGTIYTNKAAFKYLKEKGGRIINFSSVAGLNPYPAGAHYSATKGAVASWTRSVAHEWGKYHITVNAMAPALWTPMYEERRSQMNPEELEDHDNGYKKMIPIGGKLGEPDKDFAPVMIFFASDDSRFITGQIIPVDGGLVSTR
ncbi:SDR family NAD(P)-dependent oxidoreductase [Salinibacillus xinjiangensis]|uniref:SDR family oxidoreductase n=1 Tax=Salinibacillus xinjiangensis TaxID=1229268 RepID=A0A6G1X1V1_9BACI|nr:SDR family oxidoreductase [Salinibacillus xinjiangensis]MRG84865.1 SDR family oxidoreductase [Salinibacillus xinjiangensis]